VFNFEEVREMPEAANVDLPGLEKLDEAVHPVRSVPAATLELFLL